MQVIFIFQYGDKNKPKTAQITSSIEQLFDTN